MISMLLCDGEVGGFQTRETRNFQTKNAKFRSAPGFLHVVTETLET